MQQVNNEDKNLVLGVAEKHGDGDSLDREVEITRFVFGKVKVLTNTIMTTAAAT